MKVSELFEIPGKEAPVSQHLWFSGKLVQDVLSGNLYLVDTEMPEPINLRKAILIENIRTMARRAKEATEDIFEEDIKGMWEPFRQGDFPGLSAEAAQEHYWALYKTGAAEHLDVFVEAGAEGVFDLNPGEDWHGGVVADLSLHLPFHLQPKETDEFIIYFNHYCDLEGTLQFTATATAPFILTDCSKAILYVPDYAFSLSNKPQSLSAVDLGVEERVAAREIVANPSAYFGKRVRLEGVLVTEHYTPTERGVYMVPNQIYTHLKEPQQRAIRINSPKAIRKIKRHIGERRQKRFSRNEPAHFAATVVPPSIPPFVAEIVDVEAFVVESSFGIYLF